MRWKNQILKAFWHLVRNRIYKFYGINILFIHALFFYAKTHLAGSFPQCENLFYIFDLLLQAKLFDTTGPWLIERQVVRRNSEIVHDDGGLFCRCSLP